MDALIIVFLIIAGIIQVMMVVKFFQMADDLRFFRKEYSRLKPIHRIGEYAKAKGDRIYFEGEKLFSKELNKEVEVIDICSNGQYYCKHMLKGILSPVADYTKLDGDQLFELPQNEEN